MKILLTCISVEIENESSWLFTFTEKLFLHVVTSLVIGIMLLDGYIFSILFE